MRRRFMWRIGCFLLLLTALFGALFAVVASLVGQALGGSLEILITALLPLIALVLFVFLVIRLVRRAGAPLGDIIEAAGRVEAGEVGTQVSERGPLEVRSLARAFNAMSSRLESTDAARRRLLADVSHELRTPLTVMQGTLEGMLDGLYPMDAAHLAPVLDETRLLARLVEDLRTLSLTETGVLRLHREPTDLGRVVSEVAAGHQAAADAAGVVLSVEAPDLVAEVDPARVRQVVGNLIANAVRFTPDGGSVRLELRRMDDDAVIRVTDTGAGMAPDEAARAFDRFVRSPSSPGTGLGLPIARNLVEAHGGSIALDSAPGRGTTVEVRFPLAAS